MLACVLSIGTRMGNAALLLLSCPCALSGNQLEESQVRPAINVPGMVMALLSALSY